MRTWNSLKRRNIKYEIIRKPRAYTLCIFSKQGVAEFTLFKHNRIENADTNNPLWITEFTWTDKHGKSYSGSLSFMVKWVMGMYF